MSQSVRQLTSPVYSFSSRKVALGALVMFLLIDAYYLYLFSRIGFAITPYDYWGILLTFAFLAGTVYFAYGAIVPARMEFYEGFVRIGHAWGKEAKDVPYFSVTKVAAKPIYRKGAGMTEVRGYFVSFYVAGRKDPCRIPSQGMLDKDQKFIEWLKQRCPPEQQGAATKELR